MKFSLGTKIFLSFSFVLILWGVSSIITITGMENVWDSLWFVRESIEPPTEELKKLGRELKEHEGFLEKQRPSEMVWVREFLPSLRPFERLNELSFVLRDTSNSKYLEKEEKKIFFDLSRKIKKIEKGAEIYNDLKTTSLNSDLENFIMQFSSPPTNSEIYESLAREFVFCINDGKYECAFNLGEGLRKTFRFIKKNVLLFTRELTPVVDNIYFRVSKDKTRARIILSVVSAFSLLISLGVLFSAMKMLRPVKELIKGVQKVSKGDYNERVHIKSEDELGELAQEFNYMAESLKERDKLLKKQSEELIRAERLAAIGKMASIITHEIRNPLNAIALNTELLQDEISNLEIKEKTSPLINTIRKEIEHLSTITENYLSFARLPSLNWTKCEINELIEDIFRFISMDLKMREIESELHLGNLPPIMADENQLRRAILNITKNSMEALPQGGKITIRTGFENNKVFIIISDNGIGIDEEFKDRIFEPFWTTKKGGTGLGLALVQQIISEHKGEIFVESKKGKGTKFIIYLPLIH